MTPSPTVPRAARAAQALLFVLAIWAPLLGRLTGLAAEETGETEKRVLAERPRLSPTPTEVELAGGELIARLDRLEAFPFEFDRYHDDHFGFRAPLIRLNNELRARWLGVSPTPDVVIGREGWLFYAGQGGLEQYRAADLFSEEELDSWQRRLEEAHEWLEDRGIPYVVLIAPAKPTIYPEYLPRTVRRLGETTRLDQLLMRLHERTEIAVVDPRTDLRAAKAQGLLLYDRTDTHWTQVGGLVAYQALMRELQQRYPAIEPLQLDDFRIAIEERKGGDIAQLMGLSDMFREEVPVLRPLEPEPFSRVLDGLAPPAIPILRRDPMRNVSDERLRPAASVQDAPQLPHVLLFRDSFARDLIPFLAHSVRRGAYYWQFVADPQVVDHERPEVVVQELGERVLMMERFGWTPDSIGRDFELRREFRAAGPTLFRLGEDPLRTDDRMIEDLVYTPAIEGPSTVPWPPRGSARLRLRPDGEPGPAIVRVVVEAPGATHLELRRLNGRSVHRQELLLDREIVYARVARLNPGGALVLALEGSVEEARLEVEIRAVPD